MGDEKTTAQGADIDHEVERAQPIADAILTAGEQYDADRALAAKDAEPFIAAALRAIADGNYEKAALLFEGVADEYRARHLRGDAAQWAHRAADCRSAASHAKRRAKKGKGR